MKQWGNVMTDANTICHDVDLLGDWLDAKGYTEEAGLCLRVLGLIHEQEAENEKLRAENEKLRAALKPFAAINFNACLEDADSGQLWGWFFKEDVSAAAAALKGMGNV